MSVHDDPPVRGTRSVDQHLDRILASLPRLPSQERPLTRSLGLPSCDDVIAPHSLPSFPSSQMDGYAVRAEDVRAATPDASVELDVLEVISTGAVGRSTVGPGQCARIMTGAPVPEGADTVVPIEDTDDGRSVVQVRAALLAGRFVRPLGDDVRAGEVVLAAGARLGPRQVGLLASLGISTVRTPRPPRVAVVAAGDELREPGEPLDDAAIHDGNSHMLVAALQEIGAETVRPPILRDDPEVLAAAIEELSADVDLIVTIGGISKGDHDVVKAALAPGVEFVEVAMQPGKPQGFGHVGERRVPLVAVPGNPVSSYVSFEVFVLPALRSMLGLAPVSRPITSARLTAAISSPAGKRQYLRGRLGHEGERLLVTPVGGAGSHLMRGLAAADVLIVVPEDLTAVDAGEPVAVLDLDRAF
jgi:molybdopterin molybdotransferase